MKKTHRPYTELLKELEDAYDLTDKIHNELAAHPFYDPDTIRDIVEGR